MGVGWVSDVSANSHVAGSDDGGEDEHGPGPRCSGVRGNGSGSGSLAVEGVVFRDDVGLVCSHVFIGAVVGEEVGGGRGLQSRVHWN